MMSEVQPGPSWMCDCGWVNRNRPRCGSCARARPQGIEAVACEAHVERIGRNLTTNEVRAVLTGVRTALSADRPGQVQPGEAGIEAVTVDCGACFGTGHIKSLDLTESWVCRLCEGTGKRTFADRRRVSADPASALRAVLQHPEAREALRSLLADPAVFPAAVDALMADSGLPQYGPHRIAVARRQHLAFDAAVDALASGEATDGDLHYPHIGEVRSILDAIERDLNDVGPWGNGYRQALADVRRNLALRFGPDALASGVEGERE